jgi:hypothetical protein
MTAEPVTSIGCGWDEAVFRCGRCGVEHTEATEDDYLTIVGAHTDAHAVWDRLDPIERDGLVSILRTVLSAARLGFEVLAIADRQQPAAPGEPAVSAPSVTAPTAEDGAR